DGIRDRTVTGVQTCALPISIAGTMSQPRDSAEALGQRLAAAVGVTGIDAAALERFRAVGADTIIAAAVRLAGSPGRPLFWPLVSSEERRVGKGGRTRMVERG